MQVSTKFTIAVHILTAVQFFSDTMKVTSSFLAGSVGTNPVIIRGLMGQLKEAGLIEVKRGPGGITLTKSLSAITFLDVYRAVETSSRDKLFHFHERPNPQCPVGRTIEQSMNEALTEIQKGFERELSKWTVADVYKQVVQAQPSA